MTFKQPPDHEERETYRLTIVADDDIQSSTHAVTVTVSDVDEAAEITPTGDITVPENFDEILETFRAQDPEMDSALTYVWSVGGTDSGDFVITDAGDLSFVNIPDFESPADSGRNNVYEITVNARDSDGETGSIALTVTVDRVNEPPTITGDAAPSIEEGGTLLVETYGATDQENATIVWQLTGSDSDRFEFTSSNGRLAFKTAPDFEDATDADRNNVYDVTLRASAGGQTTPLNVEVTVTNKEEPGSLGLSSPQPQVGTAYTATLSDPDDVRSTTWTWESAASRNGPWTSVTGASDLPTTSLYTPDADDVGRYLRVTAIYEDGTVRARASPSGRSTR